MFYWTYFKIDDFERQSSTSDWCKNNNNRVQRTQVFLLEKINTFTTALMPRHLQEGGRNEGNVLFNDALSTFYLRLYGVGHMVEDHSDSERGNPLLFPARVLLYTPSHRQDSTYHSLCYTSRGALAGTKNSTMKDRSDDPSHHERTLLPRSYISLLLQERETRTKQRRDKTETSINETKRHFR